MGPLTVQLERLRRNYESVQSMQDEVSFLDLASTLRVLAEEAARKDLDALLKSKGKRGLPDAVLSRPLRSVIGASNYILLMIPGDVRFGRWTVSTVTFLERNLSEEDTIALARHTRHHVEYKTKDVLAWFSAPMLHVRIDGKYAAVTRLQLINRLANSAGGSHYVPDTDPDKHAIDWALRCAEARSVGLHPDLRRMLPALSMPQLGILKVATDILQATGCLESATSLKRRA